MPRLVIAPAAQEDILAWTHEHFGLQARLRYEALLSCSLNDLTNDPGRLGSHARPEIASAVRTYHTWHSRRRVDPACDRVRRPRHFVLYRLLSDGSVEIGRVLHEQMDLVRHLPPGYQTPTPGEEPPREQR